MTNESPNYNRLFFSNDSTDNEQKLKVSSAFKLLKLQGNLAYEYNPLRNYRLQSNKYEYKDKIYSEEELQRLFGIYIGTRKLDKTRKLSFTIPDKPFLTGSAESSLQDILPNIMAYNSDISFFVKDNNGQLAELPKPWPILRRKGELVDLDTSDLQFDPTHPVDILPQESYDDSVNLILNDGKNYPLLINSRFSSVGNNQYRIVNRKGDNDTNIYDEGQGFIIDSTLYKGINELANLSYIGTIPSGNLPIGNYHFYFKYVDADGNESDFFTESSLVSIFIGTEPYNIYTGFRNENSNKGVSFLLSNLDSGYQYINVYYSKHTSDISENEVTSAFKIEQKYVVNSQDRCLINITGFEQTTEIPIENINMQYQILGAVQTQTECQNRLFFGNVSTPEIPYQDLQDLSLRITPEPCAEEYDIRSKIDENYIPQSDYKNSYYNSKFIYDKTGYWPGEIYRFGIVYILKNDTLSPVFNVRGYTEHISSNKDIYRVFEESEDGSEERHYLSYNEEDFTLSEDPLCNIKGVITISSENPDSKVHQIYGIRFSIEDEDNLHKYLKKLGIKGFFFVRQKRIPTILAQAYILGVDQESHVPAIPYDGKYSVESFLVQTKTWEGKDQTIETTSEDRELVHDYEKRLYHIMSSQNIDKGAICPEYDINQPYLNQLFNGDTFIVESDTLQNANDKGLDRSNINPRHYFISQYKADEDINTSSVKIQAVEDNTKLVAIGDTFFSARAGEAEEVQQYEYIFKENKTTKATNLVRGIYGPYLGLSSTSMVNKIVNIKIPGYNSINKKEYYSLRYTDCSAYYPISQRLSIDTINSLDSVFYRGDCYICQFTHRLNRNFQDPSAPFNDKIVDPKCWRKNFEFEDGVLKTEKLDKINLGDINAVQLGSWITFVIRSTFNLNIRSIDRSNVDEVAKTRNLRGFFPYLPISTAGCYKVPEALCINKGFQNSVSDRYNFEVADVPYLETLFRNRISYSDIQITDQFKNNFRIFRQSSYVDYPITYGAIVKIIEWNRNIICIFEHGIGKITVNERTLSGQGSGGPVFVSTNKVLSPNLVVISDTFGSQWKDSIIKTPTNIYGVDTVGKKIWRTNGEQFECISDFNIQHFLNTNLTLREREITPLLGIRNVKTHYNRYKQDVLFTFYDDLKGFEEKAWNICFNEKLQKWVTFYSWIPSFSENINNSFFSFDRFTSKQIAKLGASLQSNPYSQGIVLSENVIKNESVGGSTIGVLGFNFSNKFSKSDTPHKITYRLERDQLNNQRYFQIKIKYKQDEGSPYEIISEQNFIENSKYNNSNCQFELCLSEDFDAVELCTEQYQREIPEVGALKEITKDNINIWKESILNNNGKLVLDTETGLPSLLKSSILSTPLVFLLNISAQVNQLSNNQDDILYESNKLKIDLGYFDSTIAVVPKYNEQFLTTDFWKHGQAGIINIKDEILPTRWYGQVHPFELEFVVADNPDTHKIFDNLEIISNNAEPESFHYEIIGDCYNFAKDKENMYIRQEALKELYQYNGDNIEYDSNYKKLRESCNKVNPNSSMLCTSTIFPLYYYRKRSLEGLPDKYETPNTDDALKYNYKYLAGGEIVKDSSTKDYHIQNHVRATNIASEKQGLLRGNMLYKEDKWYVQISPLNILQKNETVEDWKPAYPLDPNDSSKFLVPAEWNLLTPIEEDLTLGTKPKYLPQDWERNIIVWKNSKHSEIPLKDKFIKIRIRYSGEKLAIISAIKTLYRISYA